MTKPSRVHGGITCEKKEHKREKEIRSHAEAEGLQFRPYNHMVQVEESTVVLLLQRRLLCCCSCF